VWRVLHVFWFWFSRLPITYSFVHSALHVLIVARFSSPLSSSCSIRYQQAGSWELDPKLLGDSVAALEENRKNLVAALSLVMAKLMHERTYRTFSGNMCALLASIAHLVKLRFGEQNVTEVLGRFYLVHMICPCMCDPQQLSVWTDELPCHAPRPLFLLAKLIEFLALGMRFTNSTHSYLAELDPVLDGHRASLRSIQIILSLLKPTNAEDTATEHVVKEQWIASVNSVFQVCVDRMRSSVAEKHVELVDDTAMYLLRATPLLK
jgi:hypothetical protein